MKTQNNHPFGEDGEDKKRSTRRAFLKKATYAAPTLIALGFLLKPEKARAGFGGPPSDPTWPSQRRRRY